MFEFIILLIILTITIFVLIRKFKKSNVKPETKNLPLYNKKNLITNNEKIFYNKLKSIINDTYLIQTQVNLATIIKKNYNNYRINELFRNIDFGIFDKNTYEPLILIELNDSTHKLKDRYQRDQKVKEILKIANIPLITFYSTYSNTEQYIRKKLNEFI